MRGSGEWRKTKGMSERRRLGKTEEESASESECESVRVCE